MKYKDPTYISWYEMKRRCTSTGRDNSKWYSDKGIIYCSRWDDFSLFKEDMGDRPTGYTLDRIDNNKGYSKENCRWSSKKTQSRNQERRKLYTYKGESKLLVEWCELLGLTFWSLSRRVALGWTIEEAIEVPIRKRTNDKNTARDTT